MVEKKRFRDRFTRTREEGAKNLEENPRNSNRLPTTEKTLTKSLTPPRANIRPLKRPETEPKNSLSDRPRFPLLESEEDDYMEDETETEDITDEGDEMVEMNLTSDELQETVKDYFIRDWTVKDIFAMLRHEGFRDEDGEIVSIQRITGYVSKFRNKRIKPRSEQNTKIDPQQPPAHDALEALPVN